jgi:VCBS repeat-containing protein
MTLHGICNTVLIAGSDGANKSIVILLKGKRDSTIINIISLFLIKVPSIATIIKQVKI